jgi:hypothetical protein
MESQILLWCIVAPLLICSGACLLSHFLRSGKWFGGWSQWAATATVLFGWTLAVATALWGRQSIGWIPEEAWQQVVGPIALVGLALGLCEAFDLQPQPLQWLLGGLGAMWVAFSAMPTGEAWADMQHLHRPWMLMVAGAGLMNAFSLQRLARASAERWVTCVALAGLAGPAILAGTAYGGLAEWFLAACAATAVVAAFASWWPDHLFWTAGYPAILFAAAGTASGRFYTFEEHPWWLYGIILILPTLIVLADYPLRRFPGIARFLAAGLTAVVLLAIVGWKLFASEEPQW